MLVLLVLAAAGLAAGAACYSATAPGAPELVVSPVLDSVFVGDSLPARTVTLLGANGAPEPPGPVTWTIAPGSVATVDSVTGRIHGVGRGAARVTARASGIAGTALVVVSRPLDLTLLMDTVYLMPGDSFTIPLAVARKLPAPPDTVWFDPSPSPGIDTVGTATGVVWALATGGPVRYIAHVAAGPDTVADTGAVTVIAPPDTTATPGGRFFVTVIGSVILHQGGRARAMNYTRLNGTLAFRLIDSLTSPDGSAYEKTYVTLPDSLTGPGTFPIDSMSPAEASVAIGTANVFCNPPRPWAIWSSVLPPDTIHAFSNSPHRDTVLAGHLVVTRYVPVPGGAVIGGRYLFTAQRQDLYNDTLGVETVRGTFVAPLVVNRTTCRQ